MATQVPIDLPAGYIVGVWDIDPAHTEISFVVRHMVVSKVRGRFDKFEGTIVTAGDPAQSQVTVTIDAVSIDTHNEQRDAHVRAADFLNAEQFPVISFVSTAIRRSGSQYELDGDLRIRDVTAQVTLDFEANGFIADPYGSVRSGFSARLEIDRQDFGVSYNGPIPGADKAMVLSDKVSISLEVEAVLRKGDC
jgi:polyisoprenoid-binding protein YceI